MSVELWDGIVWRHKSGCSKSSLEPPGLFLQLIGHRNWLIEEKSLAQGGDHLCTNSPIRLIKNQDSQAFPDVFGERQAPSSPVEAWRCIWYNLTVSRGEWCLIVTVKEGLCVFESLQLRQQEVRNTTLETPQSFTASVWLWNRKQSPRKLCWSLLELQMTLMYASVGMDSSGGASLKSHKLGQTYNERVEVSKWYQSKMASDLTSNKTKPFLFAIYLFTFPIV